MTTIPIPLYKETLILTGFHFVFQIFSHVLTSITCTIFKFKCLMNICILSLDIPDLNLTMYYFFKENTMERESNMKVHRAIMVID